VIDPLFLDDPNGRKISIPLEELGLPYTAHAVDLTKDEQFQPGFLAISPNNKIPATVDQETGISLMESGAMRPTRQAPLDFCSNRNHEAACNLRDHHGSAREAPGP
jgi:Glutathione S-transferase, N-terminal domain